MNSPQPDDEGLQPLIDAVTEGGPAELAALERAASAAQVAFQLALPPEQAPNRLRQRLREDIARFAAPSKRKVFTVNFGAAGWMAAAASLGLCFYLWRSQGVLTLNSEVRFEKVVASSDLIRVDFGGGLSGSTSGEVLWSTSLQAGFLHLVAGLHHLAHLRHHVHHAHHVAALHHARACHLALRRGAHH